jgi:serine/threonine protein kinase
MARFEREAKVLASLNHPHIAQIYGVEEGALIMELVEGEPLKARWRSRRRSSMPGRSSTPSMPRTRKASCIAT